MTPLPYPTPAQERAFLQSVVYAALFDYPLTLAQLREGLIAERADEAELLHWYNHSACLSASIDHREGYFYPRGRHDLLATRREREHASRDLLRTLAAPLTALTHMPFVRMVALSGSLAHLNGNAEADLDLFVVTSARRVWTVTVVTLALARLFGWRKRLCLNYIVSERALWIAPADLFSANQIVHLQPLVGQSTYEQFLDANRFVERFYPNFERRLARDTSPSRHAFRALESVLDWTVGPLLEPLCRAIYRTHLRTRAHTWKSRDQVQLDRECLKLHTSSHRHEVMERFERSLEDAVAAAEHKAATAAESSPMPACR